MFITRVRSLPWISIVVVVLLSGAAAARQAVHEAPAGAPPAGRLAPAGEPGQPLHVSGVVVGPDNAPVAGASLYVYQTDHEGYYSVKPASDNRNPRLKLFLRTDAKGTWTVRHNQAGLISAEPRAGAHSLRGQRGRTGATHLRDRLHGRSLHHFGDARQPGVLRAPDRGREGDAADRAEVATLRAGVQRSGIIHAMKVMAGMPNAALARK